MRRHLWMISCALLPLSAAAQSPPALGSGSYTTPAYSAQQPAICTGQTSFPRIPALSIIRPQPGSATAGTPQIDQYRGAKVVNGQVSGGTLVAVYTSFADTPSCNRQADANGLFYTSPSVMASAASGCGAFERVHAFRLFDTGDIFLVHTAVYSGPYEQPWIGPAWDSVAAYNAHQPPTLPTNITILGQITKNQKPVITLNTGASNNTLGQAPVYFDASSGVVWQNINVVGQPGVSVGKAGVYESGGSNLTIEGTLISGFDLAGANGLFGAGQYSGSLFLNDDEFSFDGGGGGPDHNVYIGASAIDPNFEVILQHSWSHDAVYGHDFKSRAQVNVIQGNYFQGGLPQPGNGQAESYNLDIPNGGRTVVKDNVFFKSASGQFSNGISFSWLLEGTTDSRPQSVVVQNNTFIAGALTYDGQHPLFPMVFTNKLLIPGGTGWPGYPFQVLNNNFVAYCPTGQAALDYRGDVWVNAATSDLSSDYGLSTPVYSDDAAIKMRYPGYQSITGAQTYVHQRSGTTRHTNAIGYEDR